MGWCWTGMTTCTRTGMGITRAAMPATAGTAGLHPTKASRAAEKAAKRGTVAQQSTGITEITGIGTGIGITGSMKGITGAGTGTGKTGQTGVSIAGGTTETAGTLQGAHGTGGMTEAGSLYQEGREKGMRKRQMVKSAARGRAYM